MSTGEYIFIILFYKYLDHVGMRDDWLPGTTDNQYGNRSLHSSVTSQPKTIGHFTA